MITVKSLSFLIILLMIFLSQNNDTIIDPLIDKPDLEIIKPELFIPDSLGGINLKGKIFLYTEIDTCGNILKQEILMLSASDSIGFSVSYRKISNEKNDYIISFEKWLKKSLKKITIKKLPTNIKLDKYGISFSIKLNQPND